MVRNPKKLFPVLLWITFFFLLSTVVLGKDYFLYDLEKNKILFMGANQMVFIEKFEMAKNPDLMLQTGDPNKCLAVFLPKEGTTEDKKVKGKEEKAGQPAQLILYNMGTGRTEDLLELGYAPFKWAYTTDHQHFFISYKPTPSSETLELLHYDILHMNEERLTGFAHQLIDLVFAEKEDKLYALAGGDPKNPPQFLTLSYSPLKAETTMPVGQNPQSIFVLGPDRVVLVDADTSGSKKSKEGSVKIINPLDNTVIEECKIKPLKTVTQWYQKEKVLIVCVDEDVPPKSRCFKVTAEGFRYYEISTDWVGLNYLPDRDILYVLNANDLKVIDYKNSSTRNFATEGSNIYEEGRKTYGYKFYRLPDSNLAIIYCFENGNVKFFDIEKNLVLKNVNCGRVGAKIMNYLALRYNMATDTVVTTDPARTKFYILNRATKDITVFDKDFKRISYIVPPETVVGMFQIKKPTIKTLIATTKKIYKLDDEKLTLTQIHEFKNEIEQISFFDEEKRSIILTDKELLVLDPATLSVKNRFHLFGDPDQKYTKLKQGVKRYYFIPAL
jgi:hypothetical protein